MALLADDKRIVAARRLGFLFTWILERSDGHVYQQFDSAGTEYSLGEHFELLKKSPVDPYGSIVIQGVRRGGWLPTVEGIQPLIVDCTEPGVEGLVLYRKNYQSLAGERYMVYCVGARRDTPTGPKEDTWYICPPTQWGSRSPLASLSQGEERTAEQVQQAVRATSFQGGVTRSDDPLHQNAFDLFLDS